MAGNTVKEMTTNFGKLDKFEGHDFRRWQKKMHFLLMTLKVVYVLTTPMPELMEDDTVEAIRRRAKWENDDYICRGYILNEDASSKKFLVSNFNNYKMVDFRPVMEQFNELLMILGQYTQHGLKMDESISVSSVIDKLPPSNMGKGKEVAGTSVNMTEEGKNKSNKQNKEKKRDFNENNGGSGSNKKPKLDCWKYGKTSHFKRDCRSGKKNNANAGAFYVQVDAIAWWIDSGATTHVCKDCCWFKTYKLVEDGSVLYMGDDHFALVRGKGSVVLEFSSGKSITLFNVLYVPKLRKNLISGHVLNKCGYKQVYESDKYILSKSGVFVGFGYYNNGMVMLNLNKVHDDSSSVYMSSSIVMNSSLWHARLGHVHSKRMLEMSKDDLIPVIDENPEKWVPNKRNKTTPYELWYKKRPNLSFLRVWGCRAVVRLSDPKRKTLGEKGIDCIFIGYDEPSKAYRFYVIEPNDSISINSIIESRDALFNENRFSSIPRPKDIIPNSDESQRDNHSDDVPNETPEPRKGKRVRKAKSYGSDFQLYLVEGSIDQIGSQYSYCYSIEEDPRTYNEAMQSRDAAFWKEAIDDEIGSIMENNT
ncbi:zinc finger, CCHC-type containing protein [Tanacetum coccineum]